MNSYPAGVSGATSLLTSSINSMFSSRFQSGVTNLIPTTFYKATVNRKFVKLIVDNKYLPPTTIYFYRTLVSFIEGVSGRKVYLKFNPFIETALDFKDLSRCYVWYSRVTGFQKILGHRIFVNESLKIFHLAFKFRDPTFLSN